MKSIVIVLGFDKACDVMLNSEPFKILRQETEKRRIIPKKVHVVLGSSEKGLNGI